MIDPDNPVLSVRKQCEILGVHRSSYYRPSTKKRHKDGYVYLSAIIDLYSRKILSWRISNTQTTSWCIELLTEAMEKYGKPEVLNTDQGSQYTSKAYTELLDANGIQISMDGVGRALDNVFIGLRSSR